MSCPQWAYSNLHHCLADVNLCGSKSVLRKRQGDGSQILLLLLSQIPAACPRDASWSESPPQSSPTPLLWVPEDIGTLIGDPNWCTIAEVAMVTAWVLLRHNAESFLQVNGSYPLSGNLWFWTIDRPPPPFLLPAAPIFTFHLTFSLMRTQNQ